MKPLTEPIPLHRVLREILRHYQEFKTYVMATGNHVIDHSYHIYQKDGKTPKAKVSLSISFWDLEKGIEDLSPRKQEALWYNVILDWKQKDVAERMGITTVSVGQYVEQACLQLSEEYFEEGAQKIITFNRKDRTRKRHVEQQK